FIGRPDAPKTKMPDTSIAAANVSAAMRHFLTPLILRLPPLLFGGAPPPQCGRRPVRHGLATRRSGAVRTEVSRPVSHAPIPRADAQHRAILDPAAVQCNGGNPSAPWGYRSRASRLDDLDLHLRAIAGVAVGQPVLGAVRKADQQVHLRPELDGVTGLRDRLLDVPAALL